MSVLAIILLCLLAVSEVLAQLPAFASNSIFQVIVAILKALKGLALPNKEEK